MGHEKTIKQVDEELNEICIKLIQLMDDYCSHMEQLEHYLRDGHVHLAKSRYLMGNHSVSDLQLPTSGPYIARTTIIHEEENNSMALVQNAHGNDPMKRFGVLVPNSLRIAQEKFCKCLEFTIEAVSIKTQVENIQKKYSKLKDIRNQIIKKCKLLI